MLKRICFILILIIFSSAHAENIKIKFSHVVAPDTPKGKAAIKFKELAEKYTNGKVSVSVFPNSQLFKDRDELEALQRGVVEMLAPSVSKFGPLGVREFEVFDLPYLFDNQGEVHQITDGKIGNNLFKLLESKGIKGLAYWDNGFKHFSSNKPLKNFRDFRGQKMRIQSSKVIEYTIRTLRAFPQVMAFSEVYTALQQGVVDGTENPLSNFYTKKMHEVQKHLSLTGHGYLIYAVIINSDFWNSLPEEIKKNLHRAIKDTTIYERQIANSENENALKLVKKSGFTKIHILSDEEKVKLKRKLIKVHEKFKKKLGSENLDKIYEVLNKKLI